MAYQAKSYDHLLGTPGFSDTLLKNHFTLYQGYVANTNKVNDELAVLLVDGKHLKMPERAVLPKPLPAVKLPLSGTAI